MEATDNQETVCSKCGNDNTQDESKKCLYSTVLRNQIQDIKKQQASLQNLIQYLQSNFENEMRQPKKKDDPEDNIDMEHNESSQELQQLQQELLRLKKDLRNQNDKNQKIVDKIYEADNSLLSGCNKIEKKAKQIAQSFRMNQLMFIKLSEESYRLTHTNILEKLFQFKVQLVQKKTICFLNQEEINFQNFWKILPVLSYIFQYGCPKLHKRKFISTIDMENQIIVVVKQTEESSDSVNKRSTEKLKGKKAQKQFPMNMHKEWLPYVLKQLLHFKKSVIGETDLLGNCQQKIKELIPFENKSISLQSPKDQSMIVENIIKIILMLFRWIQQFSEA